MRTTKLVSALRSPNPDAFELLWTVLMPRVRGVARSVLSSGNPITSPTSLANDGLITLARGKFDEPLRERALLTVKQLQERSATREELVELAHARLAKRGGFAAEVRKELETRLERENESLTLDELWDLHLREFLREAPGALKPALKQRVAGRVRSQRAAKRDARQAPDADPTEISGAGSGHTEFAAARDLLRKVERLDASQFKLRDAKFAVLLYCYQRSCQFDSAELAELFADRRGKRTKATFLRYIQADIAIVQHHLDRLQRKK